MDNPNPIRYSDLIAPDNSIKTLIAQLDELIAKYESAKAKIQGAATEAAKNLQGLSGATEAQRQAIADLSTESDKLAKQYERYNKEEREAYRQKQSIIQATKEQQKIDKLLVEINNSAEGSYKRLSAQYRLNKIRLNEMTAEQRRTTGVGKELETETRLIYEEMSRLQKATGKYTLEVGHYENALKALPGPLGQVVTGFQNMRGQLGSISSSSLPIAQKAMQGFSTVMFGTIGIIMTFVRYLTGAAKTMREFEQANVNLQTILGITKEEMKGLTDSALMLGRTTEYTARQVTELQTELAKLGFGKGSIIAMQKPVLEFATAVGANLADAASVAGSTLRAFNLSSSDTEDVLATLAVATTKSALNFERIRDSIGTVFPVASAFGISVKDTTALLGALANAGFDASSAATATRNILLNLSDANGKLAQRLGGSVRTFDEIIDALIKLRKSGLDVSEALELTDKRSASAFSAFVSGAESARQLRAELEDVSGELERIEKERLNTVEGSTKLLKSAWEGLTLAFQESNGAIKSTIDWLTRLIGKTQELLFPGQTYISQAAEQYTKEFQDIYQTYGAEAAKKYIQGFIEAREKESENASKDARFKGGFLNRLFGFGERQNMAKAMSRSLEGMRQAAGIVISQIDTETKEAAERAAREAERAEQETNSKRQELTKEQKKAIEDAKRQRIADRRAVIESINLEIKVTETGTDKMLALRQDKINAERQLELEQNRQKVESERQDEAAINAKYDKALLDSKKQFENEVSKTKVQRLQAEQQAIQLEIGITEDGTEEMLNLRIENLRKQEEIEIEQNKQKDEKVRQSEAAIRAKYEAMRLKEAADFNTKLAQRDLAAAQSRAEAENELIDQNERQKTLFRLEQEKKRLETILEIDKTATKKMTEDEIAAIKAAIAGIEKTAKRKSYKNLYELLGIGFDPEQQDALNTALSSIQSSISSIIDSWNQAAEAALNAANAQVDAAQKALDAEIEARNAGYANNVETAQKELELQQKNQQKAIKEKEKAQRAQLVVDSITQSSSLITATANIWKALSGVPIVGPALAITAITTMWGSFAAAKIKAAQVTSTGAEKYAEGTVELLQGGSHASGHDIDLGRTKSGKQRKAEGGEYLAIINKRNSSRFRHIIPEVIKSFNNGTFVEKYIHTNEKMSGVAMNISNAGTDISRLEKDVSAIRRQGEIEQYVDGNGNTIIVYKNLTRKINKN